MPRTSGSRRAVRGLTLIEFMIAIAVGMFIVAGMALLFANNSRSRAETERAAHKIENGRFALELLRGELQHAGYFSVFDPRQLTLPAAEPDVCATALADLQAGMGVYVQGHDNVSASTVSCLSDVKAGTDVVVIRRVATCAQGATGCTALGSGAPAFQASSCNDAASGELASGVVSNFYKLETDQSLLTLHKRDCATVADIHRYLVRIYYVANNDKSGDGVPTLKRRELGASGFGAATSLVQGVENLQLEYGLDTGADGNPDVYTASPGTYMSCSSGSSPTCVGYWTSVMAVKVHVLTRNLDPSSGHTDNKRYVLGDEEVAPIGDAYKRSVFHETVRLNNASGRRFSPS